LGERKPIHQTPTIERTDNQMLKLKDSITLNAGIILTRNGSHWTGAAKTDNGEIIHIAISNEDAGALCENHIPQSLLPIKEGDTVEVVTSNNSTIRPGMKGIVQGEMEGQFIVEIEDEFETANLVGGESKRERMVKAVCLKPADVRKITT
jgi:hypothetical protein